MQDILADNLHARGKRLIDLARAIGVDKATISRWNADGVPAERLAEVEKATGIPAGNLRPDLARIFGGTSEGSQ